MNKLRYFFDVDGTLIDFTDKPKVAIVEILKALVATGHEVCVGSGGGMQYADTVCQRLGISDIVTIVPKPFVGSSVNKVLKTFDCSFDDAADLSAVSTTTIIVDGWFAKL